MIWIRLEKRKIVKITKFWEQDKTLKKGRWEEDLLYFILKKSVYTGKIAYLDKKKLIKEF